MRKFLILMLVLLVSPALAAEWDGYENIRFGYIVDVPPDFEWGEEADNGDGTVFTKPDGAQSLRVYGGNVIEDDFEAEASKSIKYLEDDGWAVSYQRTTPTWASYSATRSGQVVYARMIALCSGSQYATFELNYPTRDISKMDRTVDHLVDSLRETGRALSC